MEPASAPSRKPIFRSAVAIIIVLVIVVDFIFSSGASRWEPVFYFAGGLLAGTLFTQAWYEARVGRVVYRHRADDAAELGCH